MIIHIHFGQEELITTIEKQLITLINNIKFWAGYNIQSRIKFYSKLIMKLRNILIVLIVLTSCISEVDVQLPQTERVVTLNCILRPESDTIITHMAYSRPLLSTENFEGIKNEEVR